MTAGPLSLFPELAGRSCLRCGKPCLGQAKIYCSRDCYNGPKSGRAVRRRRTCEVCGRQYDATYREQRTCSRACGVELRRRDGTLSIERPHLRKRWPSCPIYVMDCGHCGKPFTAKKSDAKFCSHKCNMASRRPTVRYCECGRVLPFHRHLCDACLKEHTQDNRRRGYNQRRSLISEPYTLAEIAARDRYRCGFCGKRVAMTKAFPHPKSPVIDHIVPLSISKDDTRGNVQLAHNICNSQAGTRGIKQPALFG